MSSYIAVFSILLPVVVALLLWVAWVVSQADALAAKLTRMQIVLREYDYYRVSQARLDSASQKVKSVLDESTADIRETHQLIADKGFQYLARWPTAKRHMPTIKRVHDLGSDLGYALFSLRRRLPNKKKK